MDTFEHCSQCGRELTGPAGACPTPGCLAFPWRVHALGMEEEVERLNAELAALRGAVDDWQPRPGEPHPVDKAFHDLAVKERDYERAKVDRLERELAALRNDRGAVDPSERIAVCQNPEGEGQYVPLDPDESPGPCFIPGCECEPAVFVRQQQAGAVGSSEKLERMHDKLRAVTAGPGDDPEFLLDVLIAAWEEMHREAATPRGAVVDAGATVTLSRASGSLAR